MAHCYDNQSDDGVCRIQAQGVPAVIVGGAVRDILLGIVPHDFDIAAGLGTHELLQLFPQSEQTRNPVGTVAVEEAGTRLEVTPLRRFGAAPSSSLWAVNLARCAALRAGLQHNVGYQPVIGWLTSPEPSSYKTVVVGDTCCELVSS